MRVKRSEFFRVIAKVSFFSFLAVSLWFTVSSVTHNSFTQSCGVIDTEKMSSKILVLPSNVQGGETNTTSNYTTQLARRFIFPPGEEWEVGLLEVHYPKTWFNIWTDQHIRLIKMSNPNNTVSSVQVIDSKAILPAGHYPTARGLVDAINGLMDKTFMNLTFHPRLTYNKFNERVEYSLGWEQGVDDIRYFVDFGPELNHVLGFVHAVEGSVLQMAKAGGLAEEMTEAFHSNSLVAFRPIDLYSGYHSLYVYSDVVEYSEVGDSLTQILRVIEVPKKDFGEQVTLTYPNPYYIPVLKREFQSIEIDLKNELGQSVPFQSGRVIVTLHFKKRNP